MRVHRSRQRNGARVEAPSLDGVLAGRGVLDPPEAAGIGAAVLEALAAAHDAGVLHRDVNPGHVLLDRGGPAGGGRVVLTDFGIAVMEDPDDGSAARPTRGGEIVGSLDHLAPERAQGTAAGARLRASGRRRDLARAPGEQPRRKD